MVGNANSGRWQHRPHGTAVRVRVEVHARLRALAEATGASALGDVVEQLLDTPDRADYDAAVGEAKRWRRSARSALAALDTAAPNRVEVAAAILRAATLQPVPEELAEDVR